MEDGVELTPEQKARIEERKARIREAQEAEAYARARHARRNVIDVEATLKRLRDLKKVGATWSDDMTPARQRYMVKQACVAHMVHAISLTGTNLDCNNAQRF